MSTENCRCNAPCEACDHASGSPVPTPIPPFRRRAMAEAAAELGRLDAEGMPGAGALAKKILGRLAADRRIVLG